MPSGLKNVEPSDVEPSGDSSLESEEQAADNMLLVKPQPTRNLKQLCQTKNRKCCHDLPSKNDSDDNWTVTNRKSRKSVVKVPWSSDEKQAVLTVFGKQVNDGRLPGKNECEKAKADSDAILANRTWRQIKYCVKNVITASRRLTNN